MGIEQGTASKAWCIAVVDSALRVVEAKAAELKAEATLAMREADYLLAVGAREAAEAQVETLAMAREAVQDIMSEQEVERRHVDQERAAGALDGDALKAIKSILGSAGVVMGDAPTPLALTFLQDTFIPEKRLEEDARRHMEGYVRLFVKVAGDRHLSAYTRTDILRWVNTLERIRTTYGKGGKDHSKPVAAILRESRGLPTLGRTTIEKHVTHLKAFFLAAARHYRFSTLDDIKAMFGDIRLGAEVPEPEKRIIWPMPKLIELFRSPTWTGTRHGLEPRQRREEAGPWVVLDAYWWLPVLGIHTGARLEELAQLHHDDLLTDSDGRQFLYINNKGIRRVKNRNSIRPIALHPFLAQLGFTKLFVPGRRGRIFNDLKQAGRPLKWGGQFSEDFTAYRRACGLYKKLMDFHALRHTFATSMRAKARADAGLVGRIVGHQDTPELREYRQTNDYTHFSVADQAEAMARLDWAALGLDLSHLLRAAELAGGPRGRVRAEDLGMHTSH